MGRGLGGGEYLAAGINHLSIAHIHKVVMALIDIMVVHPTPEILLLFEHLLT